MSEYHCKTCSRTYSSKQAFSRHIASDVHKLRLDQSRKRYTCKCGRTYLHPQSLCNHRVKCNYQEPLIESTPQPNNETITTPQETITTPQPNNPPVITPQPIIQNKYEAAIQKLQQDIQKLQQENKTLKKENKILKMQLKNRTKVSPSMRQIVADNQERKCGHCQNHLNTFFQIDHIIGKQFGGDNDFDNLMALCGECHNQKSALENIKRKRIKDAIQAILQETPP
jgi:5-methylcytosine-specific restriction endonuclease McrA